jgi:hypothetical protein
MHAQEPPFNQLSMTNDIFFWREIPGANLKAERIFHELEDLMTLPGLIPIPLKSIVTAFQQHFPGTKEDGSVLKWRGPEGTFEVGFTLLDEATVTLGTIFRGSDLDRDAMWPRFERLADALDCRLYLSALVGRNPCADIVIPP